MASREAGRLLLASLDALPRLGDGDQRRVLLAVSGGPDSLALLILAAENAAMLRDAGFALEVATVDHGLRPGSSAEAASVAALAAELGLAHRTLCWRGVKPSGNLQGEARGARYALLTDRAEAIAAAAILTAHHQDDQIETHRLAAGRKAGDRGLAGMRPMRQLAPNLSLLRPFLDVPGVRLKRTVAERGLAAVDDPANRDQRFARVRLRRELAAEASNRSETLRRIAAHCARRDEEDAALAVWMNACLADGTLATDAAGTVRIAAAALHDMDARSAHLFLGRAIRAASGSCYPAGCAAIERIAERLRSGEAAASTLSGSIVWGGKVIAFQREYGRSGLAEAAADGRRTMRFDRRFAVDVKHPDDAAIGRKAVAFGAFGRGNAIERTLPVLVDAGGRIVGGHERLREKLPRGAAPLLARETVSFELKIDLPASS